MKLQMSVTKIAVVTANPKAHLNSQACHLLMEEKIINNTTLMWETLGFLPDTSKKINNVINNVYIDYLLNDTIHICI